MHGSISASVAFKGASVEATGSGEKTILFVARLLHNLQEHRTNNLTFNSLHKAGVIQR